MVLERVVMSDFSQLTQTEQKPTSVKRFDRVELVNYPTRYMGLSLTADRPDDVEKWSAGEIDNLLLWGAVGVGKTHWAAAAMNAGRVQASCFVRVPEMLIRFQASVKEHEELALIDKYSVRSKYTSSPIGYLYDDLGAHRVSDFSIEMFGLLLDRLYSNCEKGLIFTSNLSPKQILETMGERIASRLRGLCHVVELTGPDRRLKR